MLNWKEIVDEYYALDWKLVMPPGAELSVLTDVANLLGVEFPEEFMCLYSSMNGFGGTYDGEVIEWAAVPIEEIPAFAESTRTWFGKTHSNVAKRFIPFFDWHCGDATGYLLDEQGEVLPSLRTFFHEEYHFDSAQTYDEFLVEDQVTIHNFLAQWPYIE